MFIFYSENNDTLPAGSTNDLFNIIDPIDGEILSYDGSHFTNTNILSGSNIDLINIDASNITSGTLNYARLPILYFSGTESVAPYVETISPAITSSGLQNITITGDNFTPNTTINFPGVTITNLVYCSPQKITASINKTNLSGNIAFTVANGSNNNQIWSEGIKSINIITDPYGANVSLFIQGNGENNSTNIVDSSPTPKSISRFGDTKISTIQSKYGGSSIYFDGTGDYLSTPVDQSLQLLSEAYTLEAWIFMQNTGGLQMILSSCPAIASAGYSLKITNGFLGFESGGGVASMTINSNPISANAWHHVALSKSANNYYFAVNGKVTLIQNNSSLIEGSILHIGSNARLDFAYFFNGYIDSIRVTKGIARYINNFNPETDTYLNI